MMKKIWMAAAALFVAFAAAGCGAPSVKTVRAEKSAQPFVYEEEAPAEALHAMTVTPRVSGPILTEIPAEGTAVRAGHLLVQIDTAEYAAQKAELQQRIASSGAARAAAPPAGNSLADSLLKEGIITKAEYARLAAKNRPAAPAAGSAAGEAAQIAMSAVQQAISDCTILSPIDGVIAKSYAGEDKMAAAGRPLLVIRQNTPVILNIQIPSIMDAVIQKAKDEKTMTVTIRDTESGAVWYGELKPQPNRDGDPYTVCFVQADNPKDEIKIGKTYTVRIDSGQKIEGYAVPASAFVRPDQVAIVNADGLVDVRTVTAAGGGDGGRVIVSGLEEGDRVIVSPSKDLQLGMKVRAQ